MNRLRRLALVGLLLVALFGLGIYDDATYDDRWPYPTSDELASNYDQYVGAETLVFGTVEQTGDSGTLIRVDHDTGTYGMTVRNFDVAIRPGGIAQVYGTLTEDYTISAKRVTVINPSAGTNLYKYAISAVAVGSFLVVFFRYWRVNIGALRLEARDG